jgi:hypothetical protein
MGEGARLRLFENRVLRKIFGPKKEKITVEWRTLRHEELHVLYSSRSIIRMIKDEWDAWAMWHI